MRASYFSQQLDSNLVSKCKHGNFSCKNWKGGNPVTLYCVPHSKQYCNSFNIVQKLHT